MASNTVVVNPSAEDTEQALRAFEASTKTALHSVVVGAAVAEAIFFRAKKWLR